LKKEFAGSFGAMRTRVVSTRRDFRFHSENGNRTILNLFRHFIFITVNDLIKDTQNKGNVFKLNVVRLNDVMLRVIMLNVVILNVVS